MALIRGPDHQSYATGALALTMLAVTLNLIFMVWSIRNRVYSRRRVRPDAWLVPASYLFVFLATLLLLCKLNVLVSQPELMV